MKQDTGITMFDGDGSQILALSPVCTHCAHLIDSGIGRRCRAFPENKGIPLPIWNGTHDHTTPFDGDGGVRFRHWQDDES